MVSGRAPLLAAGATIDLTPPAGLPMGGYILREGGLATGAHDPLEGSLLWLRDPNGGEVMWVALDALCVDAALAAEIAGAVAGASGCSPHAVVVCASHTHSSAAGWFGGLGSFIADQSDATLRAELIAHLASAAGALSDRLEPCWPILAEGRAPHAGGNRNDRAGPHDPSVGVLGLADSLGRLAAVVTDYANHATVLGHGNLAWSADWPGAARRTLADALTEAAPFAASEAVDVAGRRPTIVFLQGAAGDASPRFVRRGQTFAEVDRLGGLVAAAALDALLESQPIDGDLTIGVERRTVTIPTRELPDPARARELAAAAERAWQAARDGGASAPEERIARTRYEGTLVLTALAEGGLEPARELPISVVRLGDAAWVHLPVELFASLGLAIRAGSPFGWTRVIGYTDAYAGYVADEAAHRDAVYEASASQFDAAGGQALADAALALLTDAARASSGEAIAAR